MFTDVLVPFGARPFATIIMALPGRCALLTTVVRCSDLWRSARAACRSVKWTKRYVTVNKYE